MSTQELVTVYCCVHSGTGHSLLLCPLRNWSLFTVVSTQELVSLLLCRLRNWSQFTVVSTQELVTVYCCVDSGIGHNLLLCPLRNWSQFTVVSTPELVTIYCCVHSGTGHSLLLCPLRNVSVHLCAGCEPDATNVSVSFSQDPHLTVRCGFQLHTGYSFRTLYIELLNKSYTRSHIVASFYLYHGRLDKYWGAHVALAKRETLEGSLEDRYFAVRFRNTDCSDDGKSYKCTVQGVSPGPMAFSADDVITVSLKGC